MDNSVVDRLQPEWFYEGGAFDRDDETEDSRFYARERMVPHLDSRALRTVEGIIGSLIVEREPVILDLMASWDSHLPADLEPGHVVGLGLNPRELEENEALDEAVLHDLNANPILPFPDATFDAVLNVVSVDYMTRPFEVFREVARVLVPGGLFLVVFSNRMFPGKAVRLWKQASEPERVWIVEDYFQRAGLFESPGRVSSIGLPRPPDDRYADRGIPSDPVYAVFAERSGAPAGRRDRPVPMVPTSLPPSGEELEKRKREARETLRCPHCGTRLSRWEVPVTPFTEWDTEHLWICFDDACPFLLRGWHAMDAQGNAGMSHRFMLHPVSGACMSVPVASLSALKDGIVKG